MERPEPSLDQARLRYRFHTARNGGYGTTARFAGECAQPTQGQPVEVISMEWKARLTPAGADHAIACAHQR